MGLTPTNFNALWNNPDNTIPTGTSWNWSNFNNHGADIRIQRINLSGWFNSLTLTDSDSLPAYYSIDNSLLTSNTPLSTYFLKGTVVNLYYWTPVTNTALQASQVLQQNASWVLSAGLWRNAPVPVIGAVHRPELLHQRAQSHYLGVSRHRLQ